MKKRILSLFCALFLLYTLPVTVYAEEASPGVDEPAVSDAFLKTVTDNNGILVERKEEGYLLSAESGVVYTVAIDSYAEKSLILSVEGNYGVNTATLSFSEDGQDFRAAGVVSLSLAPTRERTPYVVELPDGMAVSYVRIRLSGAVGAHLYLNSIEPPLASQDYRNDAVGVVTSASLVGGSTLSVKGTLEAAASIQYLSYRLVLFALDPMETVTDIGADTPRLETLSVHQKFEFRVRLDDATQAKKYVVALVNGEEILPLGDPFYAYSTDRTEAERKYKGVYTDGRIDLFEAGAETNIVEFDLNKLLHEEGDGANTRLYIVNGTYHYLDVDYTKGIQHAVELSRACGISTVLHLTGLDAVEETFSAPVVLQTFVTFLREEYGSESSIAGVILDREGLDLTSDAEGLVAYANKLHHLKALVDAQLGGFTVYANVSCDGTEAEALAQLSSALYGAGEMSYGIYFHADVMDGTLVSRLSALLSNQFHSSPNACGLLWDVQSDTELAFYRAYAGQAERIFDVFTVRIDEAVDASLATGQIRDYDADRRYITISSVAEIPERIVTGYYVLDEFDRNISTANWHIGGNVQSFGTGYSTVFAKKVLMLHVEAHGGRAMAIYTSDAPLDLSSTPYMRFSFAALLERSGTLADLPSRISGEIAFLSGSRRVVLPLKAVPVDNRVDVYIFLPKDEIVTSIDAIVLCLDGQALGEMCIESLTLYSTTLTAEEIPAAVHAGSVTPDGDNRTLVPMVLFLGMLALITLTVSLFLLRRSIEPTEK
ncbi:MAG: hypothetical protein J6D21_02600 [Clostridia bacterium]|nr:hypothetical protein [Clostridia bacterium]